MTQCTPYCLLVVLGLKTGDSLCLKGNESFPFACMGIGSKKAIGHTQSGNVEHLGRSYTLQLLKLFASFSSTTCT